MNKWKNSSRWFSWQPCKPTRLLQAYAGEIPNASSKMRHCAPKHQQTQSVHIIPQLSGLQLYTHNPMQQRGKRGKRKNLNGLLLRAMLAITRTEDPSAETPTPLLCHWISAFPWQQSWQVNSHTTGPQPPAPDNWSCSVPSDLIKFVRCYLGLYHHIRLSWEGKITERPPKHDNQRQLHARHYTLALRITINCLCGSKESSFIKNDYQFTVNEGLVKHKREITVWEKISGPWLWNNQNGW